MTTNVLMLIAFSFAVIIGYHLLPFKFKSVFLLAMNYLFYSLCEPAFGWLMVLSTIGTYFLAEIIKKQQKPSFKKGLLFVGISAVVGLLALFKYYSFFTGSKQDSLAIILPLGISYYTFRIISYLVESYRKKQAPATENFAGYAIYISFFPQIICGPIAKADSFVADVKRPSGETICESIFLILSGLFKKLVIAERLAIYTSVVFGNYMTQPSLALWFAMFFYSIQLYCDFAGYSEIAIGITRLFGFRCDANFNLPYFSASVKEFWTRWHISLSTWLRDYIYIPCGGNRKGQLRQKINVLLVFFISGVWHGSTFNFIIWGLFHGILNIFSPKKAPGNRFHFLYQLGTFLAVSFGWIIFRFSSITHAGLFIQHMFMEFEISISSIINSIMPFTMDYTCLAHFGVVCIMILFLFITELKEYKNTPLSFNIRNAFFIISLLFFGVFGQSSFIYANF